MRRLFGYLNAAFWRVVSLGRITGGPFILRSPSTLRVQRGDRVRIGSDVVIDKDARLITRGGTLTIGDNVFIGKNSTLIAFADLSIGDRTLFGENCSVHTENHGPAGRRDEYSVGGIRIGADVWLGAGVVVALGTTIGDGVTVGANSVVTKDLAASGTYAGAPARAIGTPLDA